jgi:hypothetical protein
VRKGERGAPAVLCKTRIVDGEVGVDGLLRRPVMGRRGSAARPGSMTAFIRSEGLLPPAEVEAIETLAPEALVRWQDRAADRPAEHRPEARKWLQLFEAVAGELWRLEEGGRLYEHARRGA